MSNMLQFAFDNNEIRVSCDQDGEPWFVAKDVAEALEYTWSGSATTKHIPDEWKGVEWISTHGGMQKMNVLTKQGLLYFLARSDRLKARLLMKQWFLSALDVSTIIRALQDFDIPSDFPDMYVYAIREKDTGNIKLGISRDPRRRLIQLQTGNSSELELVVCRKAENRFADERDVHARADAYRLRGEWFNANALEVMQ
jgi:hypothetical protein